MNTILYLLLGFADIIVVLAFIFKLFRFPFWDYKREFLIMGITLSVTSYLVRVIFKIPEIDLGIQYVLFILFFRYLIKFRLWESTMLTAIGILAFDLSQLILIPTLISLEVATLGDVFRSTGKGTFLIQLVNEVVMVLISYLIYRFNLGFSFVMQPPHELKWKTSLNGINFIVLMMVIVASNAIFVTLYVLLNYFNEIKYVAMAVVVSFLIFMITSHVKEMEDIKRND
ncbi:hypothetical protein HP567_013215 [Brevibacillus sp. M2.1A]|uniref:hypothetical protein n=1 Tax=Brevibacillus sp. M2.1A TaxID=2738980 RepID=UPI00156A8B98|nr:hypothetical protein [Brevibacillus sp. M2.1A]MCC8435506.1 hypothetical protein [Brevibacillus sp. M2.1A]